METLARWMNQTSVDEWLANQGFQVVLAALTAVAIFYIVGFILERAIRQGVRNAGKHRDWHRKDMEKRQNTLVDLFRNIWRLIVLIGLIVRVIYILLPNASDFLAPLFASAGIIGVAIGFGAQSLIKDFLSGIFIIAENQYRVGDIIDIEGASGTVERIGTRSTVIRDADGNVHYFPNGMVQHVMNKTMGYSMSRFTLSVDPSANIDHVIEIINKVGDDLTKQPKWEGKILTPPAFVSISEFTGSTVDLVIAGKTQPSDQWAVSAEMRIRLLEALEEQKIKLAMIPRAASAAAKK